MNPKYDFYILDEKRINRAKKNEIEYIDHCYKVKSYPLKKIIEINNMNKKPFKKFNMILDLELTIINTINSKKVDNPYFFKKNQHLKEMKFFRNNQYYKYYIKIKPYYVF